MLESPECQLRVSGYETAAAAAGLPTRSSRRNSRGTRDDSGGIATVLVAWSRDSMVAVAPAPRRVRRRHRPGRIPSRRDRARLEHCLRRVRDELTGRRDGGRHLGSSAFARELLERRIERGWRPTPTATRDGNVILGYAACRVRAVRTSRPIARHAGLPTANFPGRTTTCSGATDSVRLWPSLTCLRLALDRRRRRSASRPVRAPESGAGSPRKVIRSIGRRKPVPAGRDRRTQQQGFRAGPRSVTGRSLRRLPRNHLADQAAERRSHHDLAPGVGSLALNLPLQQVGRAQQAGHEHVDRPVVELVRRTDLNDSAQVHHRQAIRQRERLDGVVGQGQRRDARPPRESASGRPRNLRGRADRACPAARRGPEARAGTRAPAPGPSAAAGAATTARDDGRPGCRSAAPSAPRRLAAADLRGPLF